MDEYSVYFDYVYNEANNKVVLGVYIVDPDGDAIGVINTKQVDGRGPQNKYNYEYTLLALIYALEISQSFGLEDVALHNQNQIVFEWLMQLDRNDRPELVLARDTLVNYLDASGLDVSINYVKIKGAKNLAKKELSKQHKPVAKPTRMSLNTISKSGEVTNKANTKKIKGGHTNDDEVSKVNKGSNKDEGYSVNPKYKGVSKKPTVKVIIEDGGTVLPVSKRDNKFSYRPKTNK